MDGVEEGIGHRKLHDGRTDNLHGILAALGVIPGELVQGERLTSARPDELENQSRVQLQEGASYDWPINKRIKQVFYQWPLL